MNPVLLKPQSETGAQVVIQGKVWGNAKAAAWQSLKTTFLPKALESFDTVSEGADLVLVEGAGSPAEANLRAGDIANMGFAEAADLPVVLIGDIDRGGVIASILGTVMLLEESERRRLKGYVINKLRGDIRLFDGGLAIITSRSNLPSLGVVPFFPPASRLPAEDSVSLLPTAPADKAKPIKIAVPLLGRIANFDDLDPLLAEPDVALDKVAPGRALPGDADLIILPGSKATMRSGIARERLGSRPYRPSQARRPRRRRAAVPDAGPCRARPSGHRRQRRRSRRARPARRRNGDGAGKTVRNVSARSVQFDLPLEAEMSQPHHRSDML
jgi:adenosylcobyric acid synthase